MHDLAIEYLNVSDLKPFKRNAKLHPKEQVEQIKRSIADYGMNDPIAIWSNNEVIEGHGRLLACKELGIDVVPVIRLDALTDEQRREYMLVHNKTTMNSDFDFDILKLELDDFDGFDADFYDFDLNEKEADFFNRKDRSDTSRQEDNDEYNEFLDKFEIKKTTDDCYTPDNVYDAVADWVAEEYNLDRKNFVRPFYPGGDYQNESYKKDDIVVDNPPFSILSEIINFYTEHGVKFFLFAPALTLFSCTSSSFSSSICVNFSIMYENGAVIATSFLTNLEDYRMRTAPKLYQMLKEANDENVKKIRKQLPKYTYPDNVVMSTQFSDFSRYGFDIKISKDESYMIHQLDSQKEYGKELFGKGFLVSDRVAEELKNEGIKKEELKKEELKKEWTLSDRERQIIKILNEKAVEIDG